MAYTQILRALQRSVQQTQPLSSHTCRLTQVSWLLHTHRARSTSAHTPAPGAVSALTFSRRAGAAYSVLPAPGCLLRAQTLRGFALQSASRSKSSPEERDAAVSRYQSRSPEPTAAQKVKAAGRDFTYLIVVLIGLGVTGSLLFVVIHELFSSTSPNKIYGKSFDKVKLHPEVIGAFGEPIKCYGETTRRGRRQQVSHMEYLKDGLKHMRLKFYIEGSEPGLKGIVHSDSIENPETGKYEFRYIFVDVDTYPRRTIIVEDNR